MVEGPKAASRRSHRRPGDASAGHVDPSVYDGLPASSDLAAAFSDHAETDHVRLTGQAHALSCSAVTLDTVRCDAVRIPGSRLSRLTARTAWWEDCDLSNADLGDCVVRHLVVRHSRLTGVVAGGGSVRDALVEDCRLDLAALRFADLERVVFRRCVMTEVDLTGCALRQVRFEACDLRGATFTKVRCEDVDLRGSDLAGITGAGDLGGATVTAAQLVDLAPLLAAHLRLTVRD